MKQFIAVLSLLVMGNIAAEALIPTSSVESTCTAVVTTNTYDVKAVCWKNKNGEPRLYFVGDSFYAVKDTNINSKYIENTAEACAATTEYAYTDLFGDNALDPRDIRPSVVSIRYSHLDASACF